MNPANSDHHLTGQHRRLRRHRGAIALSVFVVAIILVALFAIGSTPSARACRDRLTIFGYSVIRWPCVASLLQHEGETLVALATVGLLLVTGWLAFYTRLLWRATVTLASEAKDSAIEQSERMQLSISEAARAATAMERQVDKSEDIGRRQLRAYVGITDVRFEPQTVDRTLLVMVDVKNYGETPAHWVTTSMTRKVLGYPLPPDYELVEDADRDQQAGAPPAYLTLNPGETRTITSSSLDPRFSDDEMRAFIESPDGPGQVQLYCYGTVRYRDAFGRDHWERYCKCFGGTFLKLHQKGSTYGPYSESSDSQEADQLAQHDAAQTVAPPHWPQLTSGSPPVRAPAHQTTATGDHAEPPPSPRTMSE